MAALKVFVSSTCYDLGSLRERLHDFIGKLGYEPVMCEYSDILYDPRLDTHTSCLEEVKNCDFLVLIIGGRYGSEAVDEALSRIDFEALKREIPGDMLKKTESYSVTLLEVLTAVQNHIPVFAFIQDEVNYGYKAYRKNRDTPGVDRMIFPGIEKQESARYIFGFIELMNARAANNGVFTFQKDAEIETCLKKQWAAYYQRLLREQRGLLEAPARTGAEAGEALENKVAELESKVTKITDELQNCQTIIWRLVEETPGAGSRRPASKGLHRRILWVDDYPINNLSVTGFFEEKGIRFDQALSTEEGIRCFRDREYDLIITDMGRGSERDAGLTLIRELNRLGCRVPIVVFASYLANERYGDQAKRLGAFAVVHGMANIISLISGIYGLSAKE